MRSRPSSARASHSHRRGSTSSQTERAAFIISRSSSVGSHLPDELRNSRRPDPGADLGRHAQERARGARAIVWARRGHAAQIAEQTSRTATAVYPAGSSPSASTRSARNLQRRSSGDSVTLCCSRIHLLIGSQRRLGFLEPTRGRAAAAYLHPGAARHTAALRLAAHERFCPRNTRGGGERAFDFANTEASIPGPFQIQQSAKVVPVVSRSRGQRLARVGADALDHGAQAVGTLRRQVIAKSEFVEYGERIG